MSKTNRNKRIFFDLNHPADFHFFKNLIGRLEGSGYIYRITARDKEVLHELLHYRELTFKNRGKGRHSVAGKYFFAIFILARMLLELIRFRPFLTASLSSPYLIIASKLLGIPTITYDDTDINPKLLPLIRRSDYIFSPATYPHHFHDNHFHLATFKELAYLHPDYIQRKASGTAAFFRLTRTDTIHHAGETDLDLSAVSCMVNRLLQDREVFISSEDPHDGVITDEGKLPDRLHIHEELLKCSAFWGNSPTMAAEAALLGIPAVFVGTGKFAYIEELEKSGLVFCYTPVQLKESFSKLAELLGNSDREHFRMLRDRLLGDKIDVTELLYWFVSNFPQGARIIATDHDWPSRFRLPD